MIRCPQCKAKGNSIVLREQWRDHSIEFSQEDSGGISKEGILCEGSPYQVRGWCLDCGHKWTLRGVLQISSLDGYPI